MYSTVYKYSNHPEAGTIPKSGAQGAATMRVRHIRSLDIWLMSKGNKILYRGKKNPWHSEKVLQYALNRAQCPAPGCEGAKLAA
jgi:hypothetical protein